MSSNDQSSGLDMKNLISDPLIAATEGSLSSSSTNSRNPDNSAKYHVDLRPDRGVPEGLSRVLDMMSATDQAE